MSLKKNIAKRLYWAFALRDLLKRYGVVRSLDYLQRLKRSKRSAHAIIAKEYDLLSLQRLQALRKSDRVFIFGSGYSLNDITPEEWKKISQDDVVGFNAFVYQKWIDVDFHLIRGWGEGASVDADLKTLTDEFKDLVLNNPFYGKTTFIFQDHLMAHFAHAAFEYGAIPLGARVFPYKANHGDEFPSEGMDRGLIHGVGTLCDAVHFAFCMGWKEIVLVGVDLYDTRYFWLKPDETFTLDYETGRRTVSQTSDRGQRYDEAHSTVKNGMVDLMGRWSDHFKRSGVTLSVYNPRSLLKEILPVFSFTCK